jgi:hypothetical protein
VTWRSALCDAMTQVKQRERRNHEPTVSLLVTGTSQCFGTKRGDRISSVGIATGYRLDGQGSMLARSKRFLSSPEHPDGLRPTHLPIQWVPEVTRPGREAGHSPPSGVEVSNGAAIPPFPQTPSWCDAELIKHRDNFTFSFNLERDSAISRGMEVIQSCRSASRILD